MIGTTYEPISIYASFINKFGWINVFGIIIDVLLLIPLLIFAVKFRKRERGNAIKCFVVAEKIFIFLCLLFMVWNLGLEEFGFKFKIYFVLYFICNIVLLSAYYVIWVSFFQKPKTWKRIATACIMMLVFLSSALWLDHKVLSCVVALMGCTHVSVVSQEKYE